MFASRGILLTLLSFVILCVSSATTARGDVIVTGSTAGCFGANCPPTHSTSVLNLTFTGGCFGCSTAPGTNNIGTFTLGSSPADYNGQSFTLLINFHGPTNPTTFTATLTGIVDANGEGSLLIHFVNSPQRLWTINFGECSRCINVPVEFMFGINDVIIRAGQSATLTANVTSVPEPATIFLLGAGLGGLVARHRRNRANSDK